MSLQKTAGPAAGKYRLVLHPGERNSFEAFQDYCVNGTTVTRSDIKAVFQNAVEYILTSAKRGKECDLGPLGRTRLSVRGVFEEEPSRIESDQFEYNIYWILRQELKEEVRRMKDVIPRSLIDPRAENPSVTHVLAYDEDQGRWLADRWRAGDLLIIKGRHLKFDPHRGDEGVFVRGTQDSDWTRLKKYRGIKPSTLRCLIPADWEGKGDLLLTFHSREQAQSPRLRSLGHSVTLREVK